MFSRLLIANRGEIAVRIAATARRLGIETVAVYSAADDGALHVDAADVAVALGGQSPAESYLAADRVIDAALRTACDAVHPGYGFLAENAPFAQRVLDAGLGWIGPAPEHIALLGDKLAAKLAAIDAGVPTSQPIELTEGVVLDPSTIRYPALVKAAAGGGGRGMRIVDDVAGLEAGIAAARREAAAAFGDGTVFVEPYVARGRHVEVQVIGDRHGHVVHLGERECSIQRRNQKIIEEAPSPGIDDELRTRLHEGAVALATHVGYDSAGTVEFLVDEAAGVHFLEVNTRLQVEHPVTEATTGFDLVELQLRVAAGEPLWFTQDDVTVRGHAIEARIVAEDPAAGWLPSSGTVVRFATPPGVRVDSGVADGSTVPASYDSLLAKVISHAATRHGAAATLAAALAATELHGPATNIATLVTILREPSFRAGATFTSYLDEHDDVLAPDDLRWPSHLAAVVSHTERANRAADRNWAFAPSGWRNLATGRRRVEWRRDGRDDPVVVEYAVDATDPGRVAMCIDGDEHDVRRSDRADGAVSVAFDGIRATIRVNMVDGEAWTNGLGTQHRFEPVDRFADHVADASGSGPVAPLPGTIVAVEVASGDAVTEGQTLVVLEAMKMEHRIRADANAIVGEVCVDVGDRVDAGAILVRFAPRRDREPEGGDG